MRSLKVVARHGAATVDGYINTEYRQLHSLRQLEIDCDVEQLNIIHCRDLENVEQIEKCGSKLKKLVINGTKVDSVAYLANSAITFHYSLKILNLESNRLISLAGVQCFPNLETLNVSNNQIEQLQPVHALKQLSYLNISGNCLEDDEQLQYLTQLRVLTQLYCYDNKFVAAPHFLDKLTYALSPHIKFLNYNKTLSQSTLQLENELDGDIYQMITAQSENPFGFCLQGQEDDFVQFLNEKRAREDIQNAKILQLNDKVNIVQGEIAERLGQIEARMSRLEEKVCQMTAILESMQPE